MSYNKKNREKIKETKTSWWYLLPGMLMVGLVPLIMRYHAYQLHMEDFAWVTDTESVDFFLYYKSIAIIILSAVMLFIIAGRLFMDGGKAKFSKAFIPMFVYALFVIISAIASEYSYFVLRGIREQFESVWVLLSYTVMAYYVFYFTNSERDIEMMFRALFAGCIVITLIGVFQYFGMDFFKSTLGQKLILPSKFWDKLVGTLTFTFEEGRAYVTLYNPNYVGMYASLMIPCLGAWMFTRKKKLHLIAPVILLAGQIITLIAAKAKNGIVALVVGIVLYAAALCIRMVRKPAVLAGIAVGGLALAGGIFFVGDNIMNHALSDGIKGIFVHEETQQDKLLEKIETGDDITVYYNNNILHITMDIQLDSGYVYYQFRDENGNDVPWVLDSESQMAYFEDDRYKGLGVFYTMYNDESDIVLLGLYFNDPSLGEERNKYFYFTNMVSEDGKYYAFNQKAGFIDLEQSEAGLFDDQPMLFSGRGFIWSRTLPLLKKYLFVGSGPDTFEIAFPQDDMIAMRRGGYAFSTITKPHNIYLQIGVNTGVISLIAYLLFYLIYMVWCIKLYYVRRVEGNLFHYGVGIFCSTSAYMISGIINDSTVCVAPIWWCMMGMGIAINLMAEKHVVNTGKSEKNE